MHIHVSVIQSLLIFLTVVVWGFFWRIVATKNAGNSLGQAMAFIY